MRNFVKALLGTIGLVVFSELAKVGMVLLLYSGLKAGGDWFANLFLGLIFVAAILFGLFYLQILDWVNMSKSVAICSAVLISAINILHIAQLIIHRLEKSPVFYCLYILLEIALIIWVIYACKVAFREQRNKQQQ